MVSIALMWIETIISTVYFAMSKLHEKEIKVRFARERGGSLKRELCNCFWSEYSAKMDGVLDHVPQVLPSNQETFYQIGRLIHVTMVPY